MYGSKVHFHGKVLGLTAGTGSALAVLPAQNASGNWIKIVQRLPVRIGLDPAELERHPLFLGLSTDVEVDVHDQSGAALSKQPAWPAVAQHRRLREPGSRRRSGDQQRSSRPTSATLTARTAQALAQQDTRHGKRGHL